MDTNAQIISDLQHKIGSHQSLDFLSEWKGVPVMVTGHIHEVRKDSIVFRVEPPDSICLAQEDHALILHDVFIMGIQGRILAFDPQEGVAEFGQFNYVDRGFGGRSMVRVEPDTRLDAKLFLDETAHSCQVVDISLNGFGLLAESTESFEAVKGQAIRLKLSLLEQKIDILGTLVGVFPKEDSIRLAMSFTQDATNHTVVTRYITQRRVEIRQEIQATYQHAVGLDS